MSLVTLPKHLYEPTSLQCGQTVLAMLSGKTVKEICKICSTEKETTLKDMKKALNILNISFLDERKEANKKSDLPPIALLSLETPRCWHWSLYFKGMFYDPEHGLLNDFPECRRKYYWKIY